MAEDIDRPSERLVEQRLRNRAIEALETLSDGDRGVRAVGVVEYVEQFFDVIDDVAPWHWREWTCFTAHEVQALAKVQQVLTEACAATPQIRA
jgi:hypothetical protein